MYMEIRWMCTAHWQFTDSKKYIDMGSYVTCIISYMYIRNQERATAHVARVPSEF